MLKVVQIVIMPKIKTQAYGEKNSSFTHLTRDNILPPYKSQHFRPQNTDEAGNAVRHNLYVFD